MATTRYALYYESIVPPKRWSVTASLLWDKIWLGPWGGLLGQRDSAEIQPWILTPDYKFLDSLNDRGLVFCGDLAFPAADVSSPEGETLANHGRRVVGEFDDLIEKLKAKLKAAPEGPPRPPEECVGSHITLEQWSEMRRLFIPKWSIPAYPELDVFLADTTSPARALQYAVEAILPENPEAVDVTQVSEFRESTILQRHKFSAEADTLMNAFSNCSTERELELCALQIGDFIRGRLDDLKRTYSDFCIKTIREVMTVSATVPAVFALAHSALSIPFYNPAAILTGLSLVAAQILNANKKVRSDAEQSKWAYLMRLHRLR